MDGVVVIQIDGSEYPPEEILEEKFQIYLRLWRAVRRDEIRVNRLIDELTAQPTSITEIQIRDQKLAALHSEHVLIAGRFDTLKSTMSETLHRAVDVKFALDELQEARAGNLSLNADEQRRRAAEIRDANIEIDLLTQKLAVADGCKSRKTQAQVQCTSTIAVDVDACTAKLQDDWKPIDSIERAPGYRWPLYQFLKRAHIAGSARPKARDFLEDLAINHHPDIKPMPDGLKYSDGQGTQKEANLRALQASINGLIQK
jgi:hypothetical protein